MSKSQFYPIMDKNIDKMLMLIDILNKRYKYLN